MEISRSTVIGPGYDIGVDEANRIEQVDYQTVTLDSNGEAAVPSGC